MKIAVAVLAVLLAGCALLAPQHDRSRFFTLAVRDAGSPPSAHASAPAIVLGPVIFPAYLDRNEVAVRVSPTELEYRSTERWAGPLADGFIRVLAEDLARALDGARVVPLAASAGTIPDYTIEVVVVRFEASTDGSAQLTARWAVRDATRKVQRIRQSQHAREAKAATTEGGVAALSATVGDLADEMATTINELAGGR